MVSPQVPTGRPVGHAVFDYQTHRPLHHTMGVMTAGWGHIGPSDVAMLLAWCTVVRGVCHQEVNRATGIDIAQVVQRTLPSGVARGEMGASWAGGVRMGTALRHQLRCWEVLDVDNALRRVWHVFTRSEHGVLPWEKRLGPVV